MEQIEKLCDANYLYDGYLRTKSSSSWKPATQQYERNWLVNISKLQDALQNREYKTEKGHEFIKNERGHPRAIISKNMNDKIVRHVFCDHILSPQIEPHLIYDNGASRKGKGINFQRNRFDAHIHRYVEETGSNDGYILFGDFSKFYDNILHSAVREMLRPFCTDLEKKILDEIIDQFKVDVSYMSEDEFRDSINKKFNSMEYFQNISRNLRTGEKFLEKSIDIGDQLSQLIGIYYPNKIDHYVKTVCGIKYYGRYMDDFYIIDKDKNRLLRLMNKIKEIAAEYGIFINDNKTRIVRLDREFTFLQLRYNISITGHIKKRLTKKAINRERRKLKKHKNLLDKNIMSYEEVENCYKSWMGAFYKKMSRTSIRNMKALYMELFDKDPVWKN